MIVSVPSRGILFPNSEVRPLKVTVVDVSVPSRGILFPNLSFLYHQSSDNSFRPLSGYLISKLELDNGKGLDGDVVSVPSRGILFPNTACQSPLFCWLF